MSTPRRKGYLNLSLTPRSEVPRSAAAKGKAIAGPPLGFLDDSGPAGGLGDEGLEDWRRFREAGLLDEAEMERRDRQAIADRVSELQSQLLDYQHHMGLILMEKTQLAENFEELRKSIAESQELLKREKSAHLIAVAEAEKREDNLKKALNFEKQCVVDLEKALREMHVEEASKKSESEVVLANANALVSGVGDKSLEVKEKLRVADAKLAEVNRKFSQLDMKMQELERRERVLREERRSLKAEQEDHKSAFYKQREDLREWERKLQEHERKLCEDRRIINEREDKASGNDQILRQKERDLQEAESRIESSTSILKEKERDVDLRLQNLVMKEKEAEAVRSGLQIREEELQALEEKLKVREEMEIHKLLDEQNIFLAEKRLQFESELEQRRKLVDVELRTRSEEVERKEIDVRHKEEKLLKREQSVDMKMDRVKEKEKDLEARMKTLKETEKSFKLEERRLDAERKQLLADMESLQSLKDEMENIRADNAQKEMDIQKEKESLTITAEERSEHLHLQSELKVEIEKCQSQRELLMKKANDLKEEKENFEREWEALDEKRAAIADVERKIIDEKENFKKLQWSEEERLEKQKVEIKNMKMELEALRMENESLNARMKHEELDLYQKAEDERKQMLQEFEAMKMDLEASLQNLKEEAEKDFLAREKELEMQRDAEIKKVNELKEVAQNELDEVRSEMIKLQKDKQNLEQNKKLLHEDQIKMHEDINQLVCLSQKLKEQKEGFIKKRRHFLEFAEKLNTCANCGNLMREFVSYDLQSPDEGVNEDVLLPRLAYQLSENGQNNLTPPNRFPAEKSSPGGPLSWLQKCKLKILTPSKKVDSVSATDERAEGLDVKRVDDVQEPSMDNSSYLSSQMQQDISEEFQQSGLRKGRQRTQKRHQQVKRNRSMKTVVEDARTFLGDNTTPELTQEGYVQLEDDQQTNQENPHTGKVARNDSRKRQHAESLQMTESEMHAADSEGPSDSVDMRARGRKKRRQTTVTPAVGSPGKTRYNLRSHRATSSAIAVEASSEINLDGRRGHNRSEAVKATASEVNSLPADDKDEDNGIQSQLAQVMTVKATVKASSEINRDERREQSRSEAVKDTTSEVNGLPACNRDEDNGSHLQLAQDTAVNAVTEKIVRFTTAEAAISPETAEEVAVIAQVSDPGSCNGEGNGSEAEAEEDCDGDSEHPGEVSISKKIWTFFTT
ncbi:hypothetical protein SAY86_020381 [Trapa natans]|uniref:Nuclear matrix constituent protein 1-like protein n=1 Tax=Trapa natans TaxID=22666 RepID=A0AAN7R455_TRANT|nr:hypothetical protein SAY86_020381 [Trapa natans]